MSDADRTSSGPVDVDQSGPQRKAVPPDRGSNYSWPHGPDCSYVLSRGIEWCDCRGLWPEATDARDRRITELETAAMQVCSIADTHSEADVERGVHDPALNVAIRNLWEVVNGE